MNQVAANNGAQQTQQTSGEGYLYLGNDAGMQAGVSKDLESKLLRKCQKCQTHSVSVVHIMFHYVNGITRGRTYTNRCGACGFEFKTESLLRTLVMLSVGGVCILVGILFLERIDGGKLAWNDLFVLSLPFGLWIIGQTMMRVVARFRNPVVPKLPGAT